ncbi:MAG: hypothetical protein IJ173_04835 [Kiritimatiellae bacterium]|nr:hypothetical protein [Kiritimatiellia bacterium]
MKITTAVLALAALCSAEAKEVALFLTGGQSNTEGRVPVNELPEYLARNELALASVHAPLAEENLGKFAAFAPTGRWAYDAEVYYRLGQALGESFYVAKTSFGGTSISPSVTNSPSSHANAWLPDYGSGYHWSVDVAFLSATVSAGRTFEQGGVTYDGQSMMKAWIENIDAAIDAIKSNGDTPVVKAIIWHQGESDRKTTDYEANLTAMVAYLRDHLSAKLEVDCSALPFFCGSIPRKSQQFSVAVDRALQSIEADKDNNMHVIDLYDLTMRDSVHFDAASSILFGQRLYNRMIDEGVIAGNKVDVEYCVRKPAFGAEHVINRTTTWTWNDGSGDIATSIVDVDGIYFHAGNSNNRKVRYASGATKIDATIEWTLGDASLTSVTNGAYSNYDCTSNKLSTTTTAGASGVGHAVAVNVGRSGKFEAFYVAKYAGKVRLYLNSRMVSEESAAVGAVTHLKAANTGAGVYYLELGGGTLIGARFVPDEEMPAVTLEIGESGWGTFGNLYESNFVLPAGVKAYAVGTVKGYPTLLSMSEVGAFNIGEAVVVQGTAGNYTLEPGEGVSFSGENLMAVQTSAGILEPTTGDDFFNFAQGVDANGKLVFIRADGTATLEAGKAFFSITEGDEHAAATTLYVRNTGDTSRFIWSGKGGDTLWSNIQNWAWADGEAPLNLPGAGATVVFEDDATVTFAANTITNGLNFVLNADVTFGSDGSDQRTIYPISVSGTGTLILGDKIIIQTRTYKQLSISSDIEIPAGAAASLIARGANAAITLTGELKGKGTLTTSASSTTGAFTFAGDMTGFTGSLVTGETGTTTLSGAVAQGTFTIKADDEESAKGKLSLPDCPTESVTQAEYESYFKKAATQAKTGVYNVTVSLDETAVAPDATLATIDCAELVDVDSATLTLSNAKPGLYYSIVGGTSIENVTTEGARILATGTTVSPAKPELASDGNVAYYRVKVSATPVAD